MMGAWILCAAFFMAQPAQMKGSNPADWEGWKFLLGQWVGEGSGQPGQGSGGFTFVLDLQGKVLVRKNHADYPATKDRPAFTHGDLMVIYHEAEGSPARAIYFDNEGHVIHYDVSFSEDGSTWVFLSDPTPSAPRYRLTYTKEKTGMLGIKFEIAPPGKPEAFSTYIEARARREK